MKTSSAHRARLQRGALLARAPARHRCGRARHRAGLRRERRSWILSMPGPLVTVRRGRPGPRSAHERVANSEAGEAAEVAVGAPQLPHAVVQAQSGDARVVNGGSGPPSRLDQAPQHLEVALALSEEHQAGRLEPRRDLVERRPTARGLRPDRPRPRTPARARASPRDERRRGRWCRLRSRPTSLVRQIADRDPVTLPDSGLQALSAERRTAEMESGRTALDENPPEARLDQGTQGDPLAFGGPPGFGKQGVWNLDGRLHTANHITSYG